VTDRSFVRLVDVIPESGIQQGRPMGPLGMIAGRATDRPIVQFCNGMTPRPEERHYGTAEQPDTRVLLKSSDHLRRTSEERTPGGRAQFEPAQTVYHTARTKREDLRCSEDPLTGSRSRMREKKTLQFESENSDDDDVPEARPRTKKANVNAKVGQTQHSVRRHHGASKRAVDPEDAKVGQTQHSPAKKTHSSSSLRRSTSPEPSTRKVECTRSAKSVTRSASTEDTERECHEKARPKKLSKKKEEALSPSESRQKPPQKPLRPTNRPELTRNGRFFRQTIPGHRNTK